MSAASTACATGKQLQLVLMSLAPGEEIGEEVHEKGDQFFRVEKGKGEVVIDGKRTKIKGDDASRRAPQRDQYRSQAIEAVYPLQPTSAPRRLYCCYQGRC